MPVPLLFQFRLLRPWSWGLWGPALLCSPPQPSWAAALATRFICYPLSLALHALKTQEVSPLLKTLSCFLKVW